MLQSAGQLALAVGREDEVLTAGHDQRRYGDLAETVHDRPAWEQATVGEDEHLRADPHAPRAVDHRAQAVSPAGVVGVGISDAHEDGEVLPGGELAAEPASDQLGLLRVAATLSEEIRGLPVPAGVAGGVEQDQVRDPVGVAQRVLERHMTAEGVAENRPPLEAESRAQGVGVRGEVVERHGRDRGALRAAVAPVVVEHKGELVRTLTERLQSPMVGRGCTVHQHQRVPMTDDVHEQLGVPDRDPSPSRRLDRCCGHLGSSPLLDGRQPPLR